jgi:hypothetical protein
MQLRSPLFLILVTMLIAGCGGGGDSAGSAHGVSLVAASQGCMDQSCHGAKASPVTGKVIAEEWRASSHMTQGAAGCADCHEPDAGHPNLCNKCHGGGGFQVTKNPDQGGKCSKCHGPSHAGDVMMASAPQHYGYSTATLPGQGTRASYVSAQYQGRCRACHDPHKNTLTQNHRDYAKSQHGNPKGEAWMHYDFKQDKYASCNRCHTSTGFINFVSSGFTVASAGFSTGASTREVLACDACHTSYDFKNSVRPVPAFSAPYKVGGSAATYPDAGKSNLCIPCHAGRASSDNIAAVADFTNANFVNSHYLAAAGLMYMKLGFKDFTTASAPANAAATTKTQYTYGDSYTMYTGYASPAAPAGQVNSAHRRFGTQYINGDGHVAPNRGVLSAWLPGTMDTGGPCVTCHLNAADSNGMLTTNARANSHTLAINEQTWNQVCVNCHGSEGPVEAFLEEHSAEFQHALTLAQKLLLDRYNIQYTSGRFYDLTADATGKTAVKDWTRGTNNQSFGRRMMGACYNIHLLVKEPAAYVHARTYARRLLYDSIDFLDDGLVNMTVGQTALGPIGQSILDHEGSVAYVKGETSALSSPAFKYLCNQVQPERK